MLAILAAAFVVAVIILPQIWVRWTIFRHEGDREDLPGTGSELARHLLDRFELSDVPVELTTAGDHYDPEARVVRLSPSHHDGRSLSAVAVAAHEVSHAIQHSRGERMLMLRQKLVGYAVVSDRIASVFFVAAPILAVAARTPAALLALIACGIALLAIRVVVNLVTLPVETDASFSKALPILKQGGYLHENDIPAVRSVLRACALTYVAGALISLINLARWVRFLR